jgi:hypothetical protein
MIMRELNAVELNQASGGVDFAFDVAAISTSGLAFLLIGAKLGASNRVMANYGNVMSLAHHVDSVSKGWFWD